MVFYCQQNCYKKEYVSTVTSCKSAKIAQEIANTKKKNQIDCYEVTFNDTVFFPEGGGQPYDTGHVNGISVLKVLRKGPQALHYISSPIDVGSEAKQVIDWGRRHDHMQQHSAQHLITAIADRDFGFPTQSWNLGGKISFIELDADLNDLSKDGITTIEERANEAIRDCVPVHIKEYNIDDPQLKEFRTRGLPEDASGPVRVVTIKGIDANMCCGTHVRNLADLQAIKLLYTEKGKAGRSLLYFVAGKRTLSYLSDCVAREREMTALLSSNASDHVRLVGKTKTDLKQNLKSLNSALRDLAAAEASLWKLSSEGDSKLFFHHRRDGDSDYLGTIIAKIDDQSVLKVLTAGEDAGPGLLIVEGPTDLVQSVAKGVCDIFQGRGGGAKSRFTAKIERPSRRSEAEAFVRKQCHI